MVVVLAIDAVGSVIVGRWPIPGPVMIVASAVAATVVFFFSTWLEIGVAALLLLAAAATLASGRVR